MTASFESSNNHKTSSSSTPLFLIKIGLIYSKAMNLIFNPALPPNLCSTSWRLISNIKTVFSQQYSYFILSSFESLTLGSWRRARSIKLLCKNLSWSQLTILKSKFSGKPLISKTSSSSSDTSNSRFWKSLFPSYPAFLILSFTSALTSTFPPSQRSSPIP